MLDLTSQQPMYARLLARRRTLMLIESMPQAIVAADIAGVWGLKLDEGSFYRRDLADAIAEIDELSTHEKAMMEWAILDNIHAYCAWTPTYRQTPITATHWALIRPAYLNPLNYKYPNNARKPHPFK
ncbi:MAG: hypothetical protein H7Y09_07610 [Chitinophagaceae bacterium]|nr:hypothetical protein [Anaerolineae bacterium]